MTPSFPAISIANLLATMLAAGLCIFVARECLRVPLWRALTVSFLIALGPCALDGTLSAVLSGMVLNLLCELNTLLLLLGSFLYFRRSVALPASKLLFITMVVLNLFCFLVALSDACRIPNDFSLVFFYLAVMVPLVAPSYLVLRRVLWPIVRDLTSDAWRLLWVIPLTFSVLIVASSYALLEASMAMHVVSLALLLLSAYLTYVVLTTMLRQTAEQSKQAERAVAASAYLSLQKDHYGTLMAHIDNARAIRHDFHHQLLVIRQHAERGDAAAVMAYCDALRDAAPPEDGLIVCEHFAANAVAAHYLSLAKKAGIRLDVSLIIPADMGRVLDGDLCVIVGNLLENALEACVGMRRGDRFLRVRTRLSGDTWTLSMDNSFEGGGPALDGSKPSGKPDAGIGLSSIRAAAERYGGGAEYAAKDGVFRSSVYLVIHHIDS